MNVTSVQDVPPAYVMFDDTGFAASDEAARVKSALRLVKGEFNRSVYLSGNAVAALQSLASLELRASSDNWDGEGGAKISSESLRYTRELLQRMPRAWAAPDIDLDSDGEVSLSWFGGPARRVSVSVGNSGKLSYAWITPNGRGGLERNYGVAESEGIFPTTISAVISSFSVT